MQGRENESLRGAPSKLKEAGVDRACLVEQPNGQPPRLPTQSEIFQALNNGVINQPKAIGLLTLGKIKRS